jgi:regulatory protein YycI of two-component signal transduction system YycFG
MLCRDGKCFFSNEVNVGSFERLGLLNIDDIKDSGREVNMTFHNNLEALYSEEEILNELKADNPQIDIVYGADALSDTDIQKETKPLWAVSVKGNYITLKRV